MTICAYCGEECADQQEHWAVRCQQAPRYVVNQARLELRVLEKRTEIPDVLSPPELPPESFPTSLQSERRADHYFFAHRVIREQFFQHPAFFYQKLREKGLAMLAGYWALAGVYSGAQVDPSVFKRLKHEYRSIGSGCEVLLITLPMPQAAAEALFVALVWNSNNSSAQYFTLELGDDLEGGVYWVLGEWTSAGVHVNHGPGPSPSLDSFHDAVVHVLNRRIHLQPSDTFRLPTVTSAPTVGESYSRPRSETPEQSSSTRAKRSSMGIWGRVARWVTASKWDGSPSTVSRVETTSDVTALLLLPMLRSDSVESEMVNKLIGRADRSELNRLRWEILYLKLFAVDLSMWQAYAARPVREAVWTALERHLATTFAAIPQFTEQVNQRMLLYSQAMKGPSSGVSDAIGAVFVQMTSGSVGELDRRFLAAAVFASTFEKARDVIAKAPTADSRTQ